MYVQRVMCDKKMAFEKLSSIRDYVIYKRYDYSSCWGGLPCEREERNDKDHYAAVKKEDTVIGHFRCT